MPAPPSAAAGKVCCEATCRAGRAICRSNGWNPEAGAVAAGVAAAMSAQVLRVNVPVGGVAAASSGFEARTIQDGQLAPVVTDQATAL